MISVWVMCTCSSDVACVLAAHFLQELLLKQMQYFHSKLLCSCVIFALRGEEAEQGLGQYNKCFFVIENFLWLVWCSKECHVFQACWICQATWGCFMHRNSTVHSGNCILFNDCAEGMILRNTTGRKFRLDGTCHDEIYAGTTSLDRNIWKIAFPSHGG